MVFLYIFALVVCPLLFLLNEFYIKKKLIHKEATQEDLHPYYLPVERPPLGIFGVIGFKFVGDDFREYQGTEVNYVFFYFFAPIFPIGCYRVRMDTTVHRDKYLGQSVGYRIYGKDPWRFWEVLSIYLEWYSLAFFVIGLIAYFAK